ncbi:hypothetical protein [Cohaesibacter celericrescens]|nr:hypothetical protein [Cohaesibacter celericrescens]
MTDVKIYSHFPSRARCDQIVIAPMACTADARMCRDGSHAQT